MTSSDESMRSSPCRLMAEIAMRWTPPRFVAPANLKIETLSNRLAERFGVAPKPIPPLPNLLEEVERLLSESRGDLARLNNRQRKALPYILWSSPRQWSENPILVDAYLAWADQNWRGAPRRLWGHYLLNMNPQSLATQCLARWIEERRDRLGDFLRGFSERWALFAPVSAIDRLANSLLGGTDFLAEVEQLHIGRNDVLRSAFLLIGLEALGRRLRNHRQPNPIPTRLRVLFSALGETPIFKMEGPANLRESALKSLVEGLVTWADNWGEPTIGQTLDFLYILIGDPRLHPARWNIIEAKTRQTVEGWLSKVTLEAFFRVMAELQTDNPIQVAERQTFWRRYLKSVSRAWLIVAGDGDSIAQRLLDRSFGRFSSGTQHDHAGLLLQIGNLVVLEMNKNGSTLFWTTGDPEMPGFFQKEYSRAKLLQLCGMASPDRLRLTHQGDWQTRYENEIRYRTRIAPP